MNLSSLFSSKKRRVFFQMNLTVHALHDIPQVNGQFLLKYKFPRNSINDNIRGFVPPAGIKDHTVTWNADISSKVGMILGKDGVLMPCKFKITVYKEINGGNKLEKVGKIYLDLVEIAAKPSTICDRFLLEQSKINSRLELSISMNKIQGDVIFKTSGSGLMIGLPNSSNSKNNTTSVSMNTGMIMSSSSNTEVDPFLNFSKFDELALISYSRSKDPFLSPIAIIEQIFKQVEETIPSSEEDNILENLKMTTNVHV